MHVAPAKPDASSPRQAGYVWPVVVIGGGAAGLMAGLFAARSGAQVLILESGRRPGTKIRISGGGRCNVLPSEASVRDFVSSASPHTLRNMLSAWPLGEVRAFFETDLGVALKQEATGKLFPQSDRAQDVIDAMVAAFVQAGGMLRCGARVTQLKARRLGADAPPAAARFDVTLACGEQVAACRVIVATGGLSVPKTGSDGAGLRMACALGHSLRPTSPALVPLLGDSAQLCALRGLACAATLTAVQNGRALGSVQGDFLFTHRGYSGPVVLNISRHLTGALNRCGPPASGGGSLAPVHIEASWPTTCGSTDWAQALSRACGTMLVGTFVKQSLPKRLAETLIAAAELCADARLGDLRRPQRQRLVAQLDAFVLPISGDEGYRTAEVTQGGIGLDEVHVKTFESRRQPHLYIAGEALDVIGALGGYNFLWAWVSGRRAGQAAGQQSAKSDGWVAPCSQNPGAQSAA